MEAVERYGAVRGGMMTMWRLMRCHPFAHGGHDPVGRGLSRALSKQEQGAVRE
jgi:putative component of membrane protein insertase Oxa1/YidC/SpoIIIJ protein YidD